MNIDSYQQLAKVLETPPVFIDILSLIIEEEDIELLLVLSKSERSVIELSKLLNLPEDLVEKKINDLFLNGFLDKTIQDRILYSTRSFAEIITSYLTEGKDEILGHYARLFANFRINERVQRVQNSLTPVAKVYPLPESTTRISINKTIPKPISVILSENTVIQILEQARSFSVRNCMCRMIYKNCDNPLRTCITLNEISDRLVERGVAERISLEEAKEVLKQANKHGLIHLALYSNWLKQEVYDICSCCTCCCSPLRILLDYKVKHHIENSGLVAKVDLDKCTGCGVCIERCPFDARTLESENAYTNEDLCFGCGLCVTTCPIGAIQLEQVISTKET